jgi:hypothetical protein
VHALQAYELLLAQRQGQRIAECRTTMCRDGRLLRVYKTPIGTHAAEEVTAHRPGVAGGRFGPGTESRCEVDCLGATRSRAIDGRFAACRGASYGSNRYGHGRHPGLNGRRFGLGRTRSDQVAGQAAGPNRIVASGEPGATQPDLPFVGRRPVAPAILVALTFASVHDLSCLVISPGR